MIHLEYVVSFSDFLHSMKGYRKVAKGAAFVYYFDCWVVPLIGLAALYLPIAAYFQRDEETLHDVSYLIYVGIALMVLLPLIYRLQLFQAYKQRTSLVKDKLVTCEFDEASIRFIIPGTTEVAYTWNAFTRVFETERVLTLFIQKAAFHTIPKSAMTDADLAELKRIVSGHAEIR